MMAERTPKMMRACVSYAAYAYRFLSSMMRWM